MQGVSIVRSLEKKINNESLVLSDDMRIANYDQRGIINSFSDCFS